MTANAALKESYQSFSQMAAPFLHITDEQHYEQALALIEELLEEAQDKQDDPLNGLISLLTHAVSRYEESIEELNAFENQAHDDDADVAMLRLLMDQHSLGVASFPEIGDKSLISKILSGKRNLTKQHIKLLSRRFNINPSLFF